MKDVATVDELVEIRDGIEFCDNMVETLLEEMSTLRSQSKYVSSYNTSFVYIDLGHTLCSPCNILNDLPPPLMATFSHTYQTAMQCVQGGNLRIFISKMVLDFSFNKSNLVPV